MTYNPEMHHRRSIRLKGYDYSQNGAYFMTVCTHNRECLFGDIVDGGMVFNEYGQIVQDEWIKSPGIRREIELDEFIIMPNHLHGIIFIENPVGANGRSPLHRTNMGSKTLSSFMAGFKSTVTKQINQIRNMPGTSVWQRNYWEHIIRDEQSLNNIKNYIINNPANWVKDENYIS
ncbi:transposase [candidate division WOR-3 bacterium]|nr:transposase [candidate division WOR-3 bacterium]